MAKQKITELDKKEKRTKMLTARIKPSIMKVLDSERRRTGRSYSDIIETIVMEKVNEGS